MGLALRILHWLLIPWAYWQRRRRIAKALAELLRAIGDAVEDTQLTPEERSRVWTALWDLIKAVRGTP